MYFFLKLFLLGLGFLKLDEIACQVELLASFSFFGCAHLAPISDENRAMNHIISLAGGAIMLSILRIHVQKIGKAEMKKIAAIINWMFLRSLYSRSS